MSRNGEVKLEASDIKKINVLKADIDAKLAELYGLLATKIGKSSSGSLKLEYRNYADVSQDAGVKGISEKDRFVGGSWFCDTKTHSGIMYDDKNGICWPITC